MDAEDVTAEVMASVEEFKVENPNADEILGTAKGILVCPSMKKPALAFGIERGACAMRIGGEITEFYKSTSAKWGLIAGAESHSMLMAFNDEKELDKFRNSRQGLELGVDMSVAVASKGLSGEVDVD